MICKNTSRHLYWAIRGDNQSIHLTRYMFQIMWVRRFMRLEEVNG